MKIESLDHIALWVSDRDALADFCIAHLGMHEIERTDKFTLVGADARRGKLTLFAAEGEREPGLLARVVVRVPDLDAALAALPDEAEVDRSEGIAIFEGPERVEFGLIEDDGVAYDLHHVALRVRDPESSTAELGELGFEREDGRLQAGGAFVHLEQGDPGEAERPLLNHLGLRVESAERHKEEAERRGLEIEKVVDGENTLAVFVWGPDRISLEYVEHKDSFSLE
jgi:catechol 2,3-dioxygenase-like lactoylglutathione lyase family enzyme